MLEIIKKNKEKINFVVKAYNILNDRIQRHQIFLTAAGVAFNILLYVMPLTLVALFIASNIVDKRTMQNAIEIVIFNVFPTTYATKQAIRTILSEVYQLSGTTTIAGWIGVVVLLWASSTLFSSLRIGLSAIYEIHSKGVFVLKKLKDVALTIVFALLALANSYTTALPGTLLSLVQWALPEDVIIFLQRIATSMYSMTTSFIFLYFIFRYVPNIRTPRFPRIVATISSVVVLETTRNLFIFYLNTISNYGRFYGAFAVIVSIAIWIYYASIIILLSAEVGRFAYDVKRGAIQDEVRSEKSSAKIEKAVM